MSQTKRKGRRGWLIGLIILLIVGVAAAVFLPGLLPSPTGSGPGGNPGAAQVPTGIITTVSAVSSIESSGAVAARQTAAVAWQATGQVSEVTVRLGDFVQAGDILMTLLADTTSASVPQAESDLLEAQLALDTLLEPSDTAIADAQQAIVDAQDALETAQRNLRYAVQPNVSYYEDALATAQRAYDSAAADLLMTDIGSGSELDSLQKAQTKADDAFSSWQHSIIWYGEYHGRTEDAHEAYDQAVEDLQVAQLRYDTTLASRQAAVASAQDDLDDAQANLAAAQAGASADDLADYETAVTVAEANLAEAQQTLDELVNGADPNDIRQAELRVEAAQATLEQAQQTDLEGQSLLAPIAGEVVEINYQPGDTVSQSETAVLLTDRSQLHIEAEIAESDISQVTAGDSVEITFDAISGLTLTGSVGYINPVGATVQGLVKYTVRIDTTTVDARVLLGMTASISIVTEVQEGALVAPLDAVQLDDEGEFVMRVTAAATAERVSVVSGTVLDAATAGTAEDVVLVTGNLQPGDVVQLTTAVPTDTGGGLFGGGGGPP